MLSRPNAKQICKHSSHPISLRESDDTLRNIGCEIGFLVTTKGSSAYLHSFQNALRMIKFVRGIHQWNVSNACHSCRHEENQDSEALSREKPTRERVVRVEKEEGAEESLHEAATEMDLVSESFTTALRILILISDEKRTTSRIFGLKKKRSRCYAFTSLD